jgi:hypothetical protein
MLLVFAGMTLWLEKDSYGKRARIHIIRALRTDFSSQDFDLYLLDGHGVCDIQQLATKDGRQRIENGFGLS